MCLNRLDHVRVVVADVRDADAADEIQIALAVDAPQFRALARSITNGWAVTMPRGTNWSRWRSR